MPEEFFGDHIRTEVVDPKRTKVSGKTWQGRDFIRLVGPSTVSPLHDRDHDPFIVIPPWVINDLKRWWQMDPYVTATPRRKRRR
jgi:hypothetical protein